MQSPPAELGADIVRLALINLVRARGEADGDTLSESLRSVVYGHPHGKTLFTLGLAATAVVFHRHIVNDAKGLAD